MLANETVCLCLASINFCPGHLNPGFALPRWNQQNTFVSPGNSHLDTLAADEPVKRLDKSSKRKI